MISTEQERRPTSVERATIRRLISERPVMQALRIGYHIRNEAEALDVLDLLKKYVPERQYTGLVGSRLAGIIVHSERRLRIAYKGDMTLNTIRGLRREWPLVAATADGRLPLMLPTVSHSKIANRPANKFFYDIDVVAVPKQFNGEPIYETEPGDRSGTKIEIFIVPPQRLLSEGHPFYPSIFLNSERLPYPYTATRTRVNFANIFRGWRKKTFTDKK